MAAADFGERFAAEQIHGLLRAAVDRVVQLQVADAVVVVGARFEEQLLDRRRLRVAARLAEAHHRRLIVDDVDRVLRGRIDFFAVRPGELDLVEALRLDREVSGQRSVRLRGERGRGPIVQHDASAGRLHRRRDAKEHVGAADRGNVACVLDLARRQPRIRGEAVLEIELRHGR